MAYASAMYSSGISVDILANDLTKEGIDSAVNNFRKLDEQSAITTANLAKVTAAFAAITGAAMYLSSAADRVEGLERSGAQAAVTAGMTSDAFYEMADAVDSASDQIEDIISAEEYLTHNGVILEEEIKSLYYSFDLLADGIGQTSTQTERELIPMMRALGIPLQDVTKYTDALTIAVKTTNLSLGDLAYYTKRYGEQFTDMGADIYKIIALFETLSQLAIEGRPMMTKLNEAFKEQGANAKLAADGLEDLVKVQKDLNEEQLEGSRLTKYYAEDLQAAGNDVDKLRNITMTYNRRKEESDTKISGFEKDKADLQAIIDKANAAPKFSFDDFLKSLTAQDPRITKALVDANFAAQTSPENKKKVAEWQTAGEMTTGGERAAFWSDQKFRDIGKNINPAQSMMIKQASDVGKILTAALGIWTAVKALGGGGGGTSVTGAAADAATLGTTAASLGGSGAIAAAGPIALLAGASLITAYLVKTGVDVGNEENQNMQKAGAKKAWLAKYPKGDEAMFEAAWLYAKKAAFMEQYGFEPTLNAQGNFGMETQMGMLQYGAGGSTAMHPYNLNQDLSGLPPVSGPYAEGGVVPGEGAQLAIVHGGETITPAGRSISDTLGGGFGNYGSGDPIEAIINGVKGAVQGMSITIQNVNLSKDYNFQQMMKDIEAYQSTKRKQMGVRTS